MRTNKLILETKTSIWRAQSVLSSEPKFSHFSQEMKKLWHFNLLVFFSIQLTPCNIRIQTAAIASGLFSMNFSTVFCIYLLNLVVWWLKRFCLYTDHWKITSFNDAFHWAESLLYMLSLNFRRALCIYVLSMDHSCVT